MHSRHIGLQTVQSGASVAHSAVFSFSLVYLGSPLAVTLGNSYSSWGPQNIIQNTYNNIEFKIKNKNTNIARENNSLHHKRS